MDLSIKEEVRFLLVNAPIFRDDDRALIAQIWRVESYGLTTRDELLEAFADGVLSNPESIRRSRAALQVKHPELRGELYEARHAAEAPIIDELNEIKNEPDLFNQLGIKFDPIDELKKL